MAPFNTEKEWKTVRVDFNKLAQSPYFGKKVPFDPKTILMIAFSATAKEYPIDIDLKNIHLVK